jgi:hypothetical protein
MKTYLRIVILMGLWSLFTACGQQVGQSRAIDEQTSDRQMGSDGSPFHSYSGWKRQVTFLVENLAPDEVVEASIESARTWNDAVGREVLAFDGTVSLAREKSLYSSLNDEVTTIYYVEDWSGTTGKSSSTLATTIWQNAANSDLIVRGDILLNAEQYVFVDAMTAVSSTIDEKVVVDAQTVLLHEFGHLMGLEHVSFETDGDSVMHAKTFIGARVAARNPSNQDIENLKSLYP